MHNIDDLHRLAKKRLPRGLYAMLERGAEDEVTMERNRSDLAKLTLKPRTLVDVSKRSLEVTLFGTVSRSPVMIGPTGFAGLGAFEGELKLARAAAAGVPYVLGSVSMTSMERVMQHGGGGRLWFQLFPRSDLTMNDEVIERMTILIDSGFRRGTDVIKALALGAYGLLLGRAALYGLSAAGEAGAARALAIFHEEIDRAMAFLGCNRITELNRELLAFDADFGRI